MVLEEPVRCFQSASTKAHSVLSWASAGPRLVCIACWKSSDISYTQCAATIRAIFTHTGMVKVKPGAGVGGGEAAEAATVEAAIRGSAASHTTTRPCIKLCSLQKKFTPP